jgi:hypothetical protein
MNIRTTASEDRDFIASLISSSLLEDAIDYILDKYDMEDLYGVDTLHEWALENGYVKED